MLKTIFTLDYEIHGNGDGCSHELMVEPTDRLLRLFDSYGAKLTIMADVAEILKFREYKEATGRDDYHYDAIAAQLRRAVGTGHDVQLHIHSSYFNATHQPSSWVQDWSEYNFAGLPYARMDWMVGTCKQYLEALLRPAHPAYSCVAFRAANWAVSPSHNVVAVLTKNGIRIDTSVFKYGRRRGSVTFDYSNAHSAMVPWRASAEDICGRDDSSTLWEFPIYCENRWLTSFASLGRIRRVLKGFSHKVRRSERPEGTDVGRNEPGRGGAASLWRSIVQRNAWKADFNQCSGRQLVRALDRASARHAPTGNAVLPFVLIGHSKLFTHSNERSLRPFLSHVVRHPDRFGFDTLSGANQPHGHWDLH